MAASSPALSNHSPAIAATPSPSPASGANPVTPVSISAALSSTNLSKNLRGLNKPKCIKCGNVARSRCPYQSCKSCCAKAQNPCHIHVLKSATFTDKTQSSSSPLFDQQSTEGSPSGNAHRFSSLRQLSNNFAQFNNLQSPLRSKKPLTRKDAAVINEWRFKKLKEYKEGNIEVENEAFDRYMQNVTLLEEVLAVNPKPEEPTHDGSLDSNPVHNSAGDDTETVISGLKIKLRSNPVRTEKLRKRLVDIINQGLRKLRKIDVEGSDDPNKQDELVGKQENEKYSALSDLLDKLNKARSEEDLKSCLEMKSQLFDRCRRMNQMETEGIEVPNESAKSDSSLGLRSEYFPPKWLSTATIEQDALNSINIHFSSLEEVESL